MLTDELRQQGQEMSEELKNWLGDLWNLHFDEIVNVAEASGGETGVTFSIELDLSAPSAPRLRGTLDFKRVEKFSDSRERQFGDPDPDQIKLGFDGEGQVPDGQGDPIPPSFESTGGEGEAPHQPPAEPPSEPAAEGKKSRKRKKK